MKIEKQEISIKDIYNGYVDNDDDGVFAFGGKLAIRPPYQREFVYNLEQEKAVIDTILKGFPLNIMYWVKTSKDAFEILDGQQRTLSVMHFLDHKFSIMFKEHQCYVDTLTDDIYDKLINYKFDIYICEGDESEKLEWFKVVNVAGEELTDQELRNSVYTGEWLSNAKKYFSKRNCVAKQLSDKYIKGDPNRQELLEKALKGIIEYQGLSSIEDYMSKHKSDENADELWQYFQDVIGWVQKIFQTYSKDMQGLEWCHLYNKYSKNKYDTSKIDKEIKALREDDEIGSTKGIYEYILDKDNPFREKYLNLRTFIDRDKQVAYNKQKGICPICKKHFEIEEMEADHIIAWSQGGKTEKENCQMLCRDCNRQKSDK